MFTPCILIPIYNHEEAIITTIANIQAFHLPCILVNDGSSEKCTQILRQLAQQQPNTITLVEHAQNQGKGAAVKTGLLKAQALGFSHSLQIDADGQHNTNDIPLFLATAQAHPLALITGCPAYDASVPKHRLYARYITHVWVWINTLSFTIKDSMCGFRVYPLASTCQLLKRQVIADRMAFDTEILVRLVWKNIQIISLPTQVHYPDNGVSHFLALRDNLLISKMHAKLFFGMLVRLPKLLLMKLRQPT